MKDRAEYFREYNRRPEMKAYQKRWREENKEYCRARRKRLYLANRERHRECARLLKYGITPEQFNALLDAQGGVCAICKEPEKVREALSVDHCHVTNRVRGLLCGHCNTAIGLLRDKPDLCLAAAEYLK